MSVGNAPGSDMVTIIGKINAPVCAAEAEANGIAEVWYVPRHQGAMGV